MKAKKKNFERTKKHRWDETLVMVVLLAAAVCILILFTNYASVTGRAYSVVPSKLGLLEMLNGAVVLEGQGKMKCDSSIGCGQLGKDCILAKQDGLLKKCSDRMEGQYYCVCASINR